MSKHLVKTLIVLIAFGAIGVFGVWVTNHLDTKNTTSDSNQSVTSVINSVLKRINK